MKIRQKKFILFAIIPILAIAIVNLYFIITYKRIIDNHFKNIDKQLDEFFNRLKNEVSIYFNRKNYLYDYFSKKGYVDKSYDYFICRKENNTFQFINCDLAYMLESINENNFINILLLDKRLFTFLSQFKRGKYVQITPTIFNIVFNEEIKKEIKSIFEKLAENFSKNFFMRKIIYFLHKKNLQVIEEENFYTINFNLGSYFTVKHSYYINKIKDEQLLNLLKKIKRIFSFYLNGMFKSEQANLFIKDISLLLNLSTVEEYYHVFKNNHSYMNGSYISIGISTDQFIYFKSNIIN